MGRPCTKCPPTTVQSCCGNPNLRIASVLIGFFKLIFSISCIVLVISALSGSSGKTEGAKEIAKHSTAELLIVLLLYIALLILAAILLAGLFKKRRNYVMMYWAPNCVLLVLMVISLCAQPPSVAQFVMQLFYILLDVYFQLVIRSYYLQMTGATTNDADVPHSSRI